MHHEAMVEHAAAKNLIAQIQGMSADDDYFDAKVTVLSEMIKHHVKEEEQPGGMFAEARKSNMDLISVGERLQARQRDCRHKLRRLEVKTMATKRKSGSRKVKRAMHEMKRGKLKSGRSGKRVKSRKQAKSVAKIPKKKQSARKK